MGVVDGMHWRHAPVPYQSHTSLILDDTVSSRTSPILLTSRSQEPAPGCIHALGGAAALGFGRTGVRGDVLPAACIHALQRWRVEM